MQLINPEKSFTTLTYIQKYCKFSEIKKEFLNKPITKLNVLRSRAKCVLSQIFTSNTRIKNENTADDNEQLNSKQIHKKNK